MKNHNTLFISVVVVAVLISSLFFFVFPFQATAAESPIETKPAMFLNKTRVQLNGFLDPSDLALPADYWFEWGRTDALGNFTYPRTVRTTDSRPISERITLPDPSANYFFRAVIQNHESKNYGQIMLFKVSSETVNSKSFSSTASASSASSLISQSTAGTSVAAVVPAVSPLTIKHTVANLSFLNGAESVVAGKAGDIFEFLISIENTSDKPIYNLRVSDKLSIFLEFVDASSGYKHSNGSQNEVFWNVPKLASKGYKDFRIQVRGKEFSENLVIENSAIIVNKDFSADSETTNILLNNSLSEKNPANLTAAIAPKDSILPDFLAWMTVFALSGLSAIIFYNYRRYRNKKEKELLMLTDTIKALEQKLKILTENQEEQNPEER